MTSPDKSSFALERPKKAEVSRSDDTDVLLRAWREPAELSIVAELPAPDFKPQYEPSELEQYDLMLTWMIITYFACLAFGWGLLAFDYLVLTIEKKQKTEPWISDAVIIGGASAVLSPIIQWSNTIIQTKKTGNEMTDTRLRFLKRMLAIYFAIVGGSTLIAVTRFSLGEDGSLHHFISTTSNHLVLARISASLLSWGAGKLFIRWYKERLSAGPLF